MDTSSLTFNVIYTPETVRYLTPFVTTLLQWSDCRYRLISNGCSASEVELLGRVVDLDDRLELLVAPGEGMTPHGKMLNWLHEREDPDYFCFMDSDLLATGPFLREMAPEIEQSDCFSSCLPLWRNDDDIISHPWFRHLHGIHAYTDDGRTVACAYFVIYDNKKLTQAMQDTGVSLDVIGWDALPATAQSRLAGMSLQKKDYDTCKALTLLMLDDGASVTYRESDALKHIGGFTEVGARRGALLYSRGKADRLAAAVPGPLGNSLMRAADAWYARRSGDPRKSPAERQLLASRIRRRTATARYFYLLLIGLMDDKPVPAVPRLGDPVAEQRIRVVSGEIRDLIARVRREPGPWQDSA